MPTLGQAPKSQSTPAPEGNHLAICYSVVDAGTHAETGKFGTKTHHKIKVSWELPEETHTFKEERGPEPFSVHRTYNFTTDEKGNLRRDLEAWRGKKFTAEELNSFELFDLVGVPCMVTVVHNNADGKTYANISAIAPVPKAMKGSVPALHNTQVRYDFLMGRNEVFSKLPKFMQDFIGLCHEWNGGDKSGSGAGVASGSIEEDDFIPF